MAKRKNEAAWREKDERWCIRVQVDGERRSFYSSIPGRRGKIDCEGKADDWLETNLRDENARVSVLFDDFIKEKQQFEERVQQFESIGNHRIIPYIGKKRIGDVTEQDLQDIINKAYADGLSKKSLRNIRGCITGFFTYCRKRKATTLRPSDLVIHKNAPVGEKKTLQPIDIQKVFDSDLTMWRGAVVKDRYINLYRFAITTGLRPGELCGLQWKDICDNGIVEIKRAINIDNVLTSGKNENAHRRFKMIPQAAEAIAAQKELLKHEGIVSLWVFPWYDGSFTAQENLSKYWIRYIEYNSIPHVSLYEMSRHTNVSVNKNMPQQLLKMAIGHSESMDTLKNYGHELDGEIEDACAVSTAIFAEILPTKST